jgi:16S rRNA (cytosine1402-N4)-methyltransferase
MPLHVPVLPSEILHWLDPKPGQIVVDATLGAGGHTRLLAERVTPGGEVIALDLDAGMIARAKPQLAGMPMRTFHAGFDQLRDVLDSIRIDLVDAVLADLGVASDQLDDPARGFSFQSEGPLDMRLDPSRGATAADLVARLPERELADLIWRYGEERRSRRIAKRIHELRQETPITTAKQLADIVRQCVPRGRDRIDPATRTFQALRIAVNEEISALEQFLRQLPHCVKPGGRVAIISFHSLEDRPVKRAFRNTAVWRALTKKPLTASEDEVRNNPRSRSAKLRVAERLIDAGGKS